MPDYIIPDLLPPSEDGVFKTLMTHPDAKPVLRDVIESYLRFPVVEDEIERAHFRSRRMFRMDMEHNIAVAKDEGRAEGRAEGRTEGQIATAKNLLKMDLTIGKIVEATGLTREEVERLYNKD